MSVFTPCLQSWEEGRAEGRKFSGDLLRVPFEYSSEYCSADKCKKIKTKTKQKHLRKTKTKTSERISGNSAQCLILARGYEQGYSLVKLENFIIHRAFA